MPYFQVNYFVCLVKIDVFFDLDNKHEVHSGAGNFKYIST